MTFHHQFAMKGGWKETEHAFPYEKGITNLISKVIWDIVEFKFEQQQYNTITTFILSGLGFIETLIWGLRYFIYDSALKDMDSLFLAHNLYSNQGLDLITCLGSKPLMAKFIYLC